ncbi:unnamed protein product [Dovyalis caffra]|uniref:Uncharacterized protein n=1 Tax=Dovyalis caffra TaxID=77055 RepID=A0AAV1SJP9_9ROSI|nr:unnamed protein product [Dovyalis caffra]
MGFEVCLGHVVVVVVEMDKTTGGVAAKKPDVGVYVVVVVAASGAGKDGLNFEDWKWVKLMVSKNNHLPSNVVAFVVDDDGCSTVHS